eukprot:1157272-Pelagomonas_calceolata.AAC.3
MECLIGCYEHLQYPAKARQMKDALCTLCHMQYPTHKCPYLHHPGFVYSQHQLSPHLRSSTLLRMRVSSLMGSLRTSDSLTGKGSSWLTGFSTVICVNKIGIMLSESRLSGEMKPFITEMP